MNRITVYLICLSLLLLAIADWYFDVLIPVPLYPLYEIGLGLQFGIISFVYADILTQPGHLLGFWRSWVETKFLLFHVERQRKFDEAKAEKIKSLDEKGITYINSETYNMADEMARHRFWLKPILTCSYCIGGELALWVYPFKTDSYSVTGHLAVIYLSILTSGLLSDFYQKWKTK